MSDKPAPTEVRAAKGLEDVIAGPSGITFLDGFKGRMVYRGYDATAIADKVTFEETIFLLWKGELPNKAQLETFRSSLAAARPLPAEVVAALEKFPKTAHPMDVLRTAVSFLGLVDPDGAAATPEANGRKAVRLVAQMATLSAAWDRIRKGRPIVPPDPALSHSANYLYMVTGTKPDALSVQAMDQYLTLLADHDLNASTFTACVVTSTLADLHGAVTAAIAALKGPLHGGANEKAMEMFLEIADPAKTEAYVEKAVAEKRKIMGFGHRVYKVEDPRSAVLKPMAERIGKLKGDMRWYEISVKVADTVHRLKNLNTNVDFYSASILYQLGIPPDMFTTVFAVSRVAGWCAHVTEQLSHNRLIRPRTEYTGPTDRTFRPLDQRP